MIESFHLEMNKICKSFPGVRALDNVDLLLGRGEVLALMGENGAGKSTLIKTLSGAIIPDSGSIRIEGKSITIHDPVDAQNAGVAVIYQEFNLIPSLSARENIFLGRERTKCGFLNRREESRNAADLFERIGVRVNPKTPCNRLSVAQQQAVEIAKALSLDARIIVMDEPSATLTLQEVKSLFAIIRDLKSHGIGVIYISHRLDEIFEIADRVMVMRDGRNVGSKPVGEVTRSGLIEMMVGRTLEEEFPKVPAKQGAVRLAVKDLVRSRAVKGVSFEIRSGEILALTGLVGAGRTETARLIFGADPLDSGTITLDGKELKVRQPKDAIRAGICLLTEDRKSQGLILGQSVRTNFGLPNLPKLSAFGFVKSRHEREAFGSYVEQLKIKIPYQEQIAKNLSGGNQQKVVLAKWLEANSEIVIFDEPTRGIDVGTKYEIYLLMNELAARGKAVLIIGSELPEVLGMADRILVMHEGRISGEILDVSNATQEEIMAMAVGLEQSSI